MPNSKQISVYAIDVPEYDVRTKPDWRGIGAKLDEFLRELFLGRKIVIRCIGSCEHPGKSLDDLVEIILEQGSDRYDPSRPGDRYENIENKPIDIFALEFKVEPGLAMMENIIEPFYTWPLQNGKKPTRLDLMTVYDAGKLEVVEHMYEGRNEVKKDGFIFKNQENKSETILAIVKLL